MYFPWREQYQRHREEDTEPDETVEQGHTPPWKAPFFMRFVSRGRKRTSYEQNTHHSQPYSLPPHDPIPARESR